MTVSGRPPPPIAPLTVKGFEALLSQVWEAPRFSGAEMVSEPAPGSMAMPYVPPSKVLVPISVRESPAVVLLIVTALPALSHSPPTVDEAVSTEVPE